MFLSPPKVAVTAALRPAPFGVPPSFSCGLNWILLAWSLAGFKPAPKVLLTTPGPQEVTMLEVFFYMQV